MGLEQNAGKQAAALATCDIKLLIVIPPPLHNLSCSYKQKKKKDKGRGKAEGREVNARV